MMMNSGESPRFRSLFPHEPLPKETNGYVLIQGAFSPRCQSVDGELCGPATDKIIFPFPILLNLFKKKFCEDPSYQYSSLCLKRLPHVATSVELLETEGNCTKARLTYAHPQDARRTTAYLKKYPPTPHQLFNDVSIKCEILNHEGLTYCDAQGLALKWGNRNILATQITTSLLTIPQTQSWIRSVPPKFRHLVLANESDSLHQPHVQLSLEALRFERSQTRFVFITNINPRTMELPTIDLDNDAYSDHSIIRQQCDVEGEENLMQPNNLENEDDDDYDHVGIFQDALRKVLKSLDSTNLGIELFVYQNSNHRQQIVPCLCQSCGRNFSVPIFNYCHVGMRCPQDAQRLVSELQGQRLTLTLKGIPRTCSMGASLLGKEPECCRTTFSSGPLYLDLVDISKKSLPSTDLEVARPSLPECTSTTSDVQVPGLILISEFLSTEEEEVLLAALTGPDAPWAPLQRNFSNTGMVKRRVQHYGYVFDYETADVLRDRTTDNDAACCPPIPDIPGTWRDEGSCLEDWNQKSSQDGNGWALLACITQRLRKMTFSSSDAFLTFPFLNQITVNEYKPGEGIGSHVDTPHAFADGIISLSLGSDCVMEFRLPSSDNTPSNYSTSFYSGSRYVAKKLVYLPRRSLLIMSGPSRYNWEHMIVSRMTDLVDGTVIPRRTRISITFRTALNLPPDGSPLQILESSTYPPQWGFASSCHKITSSSPISSFATPITERKHVHAVYDAIATQWNHTRAKRGVLWPMATQFLRNLPRGSIIADIGCGDGKYFPVVWDSGCYVIGLDISLPLLLAARSSALHGQEAANAKPPVVVADCIHIPIKDDSVDAAICIAVMHHLSTVARRIRCLEELSRIVKDGCLINVQAWAKEQEESSKWKFAGTDVFVPFNVQPRYLEKVKHEALGTVDSEMNNNDTAMPKDGVGRMYSEAYEGAEYDETKGLVVFHRYCHLYRKGELEELVSQVPTLEVIESGIESGNHFVILRVRRTL